MDTNIFIGIAVLFLTQILTVGALLTVLKLLHWVFAYDDRLTMQYRQDKFKRENREII